MSQVETPPRGRADKGMLWLLLTVALSVLLCIQAYYLGQTRAGVDGQAMRAQRARNLAVIDRQNFLLRDVLDRAERYQAEAVLSRQTARLELLASDLVREQLTELSNELVRQQEKLAFYRSIMAPQAGEKGLRIKGFSLQDQGGGMVRYDLLLLQVSKRDRVVKGKVDIRVHGRENGLPKTYTLKSLAPEGPAQLSYRFRYYQDFSGRLRLPEGFLPQRVELRMLPGGPTRRVVREFGWAELLADEDA